MLEQTILEEIDEKNEETHDFKKLINIPLNRIVKKMLCANFGKLMRRTKL